MGDYSTSVDQIVNAAAIAIANWSTAIAIASIRWLLSTLGQATEPDLTAIVPVYDRMLAIALLILGAIVALALIERIAWSSLGTGLALIPRVVAATFFAYAGLGVVKYVAGYAALLGMTWTPDLTALANAVGPSGDPIGVSAAVQQGRSVLGLILTALFLAFMALMVYLELIVRSALILTVAAFVPLVCALSVWPRMASSAVHLGEFLIGLLLSKFVVATVLYVGLHLVVPALINGHADTGHADWMESGVAVLLIAAFSPLVLFQALRFAHGTAGSVARNFGSAGVGMAPLGSVIRLGQGLARHPSTVARRQQITGAIASRFRARGTRCRGASSGSDRSGRTDPAQRSRRVGPVSNEMPFSTRREWRIRGSSHHAFSWTHRVVRGVSKARERRRCGIPPERWPMGRERASRLRQWSTCPQGRIWANAFRGSGKGPPGN